MFITKGIKEQINFKRLHENIVLSKIKSQN